MYHRQTFFTSDIFDFATEVLLDPNPAKFEVNIRFGLSKSADVTLKMNDAAGQIVHTVESQNVTGKPFGSSNEKFIWNFENQAGEGVTSSVCIYILEAASGEQLVNRSGEFAVVR
ncbi:MAG: hypothetical protein OXP71_15045 [Candidatus Poribacteria bacterium]|nr:hypothetical protein [Candidatus Poribacteria bacterium]